jgi:hypothetical protein
MLLILIGGLLGATALAQKGTQGGGERHPKIRQAINALQNAKGDLQNAAHDFCGHRVEALEATNNAINQLQKALASDTAMNIPAGAPAFLPVSYLQPIEGAAPFNPRGMGMKGGERHPMIRRAINALEGAKDDLQNAAHDFRGHRVEALEAVNRALNQLQAALACDKN